MAGDWIKMRIDLQSHPKVVRILSATNADKFRVIGGLHAVWSVFDTHSVDGVLPGYTPLTMDHIIGWQGFSDAMIAVGWLVWDGKETLSMPEFTEHNGKSGKRRAEDQKRKKASRICPHPVRKPSAANADKLQTREEKRREENKEPPNPLPGGKRRKPKFDLPEDFTVPAEWIAQADADFPNIDWPVEAKRFLSHHRAKASQSADWRQSWATWVHGPYPKTVKRGRSASTDGDLDDILRGAI